ncbi:MAG: S-layer homology domain-containing protein [Chloroflexia bacterium]
MVAPFLFALMVVVNMWSNSMEALGASHPPDFLSGSGAVSLSNRSALPAAVAIRDRGPLRPVNGAAIPPINGALTATPTSTVVSTPTRTSTPAVTPCVGTWREIVSPDVRTLNGVAAISANDVWAVGNNGIVHWNGTVWSTVPSPFVWPLKGVSAVSSDDVWAAGATGIIHWNGTAWTFEPSPVVSLGTNTSVYAVSTNLVWAVGYYPEGGADHTLIKRWNGSEWSVIPSPNGSFTNSYLTSVSATSDNDAWAVGYSTTSFNYRTLILHWDGSAWSVVPSPSPGFEQNYLTGVVAISATDAWAVGYCYCRGPYDALTLHWNGASWTQVATPNLSSPLYGVSASSGQDVWAVGSNQPFDGDTLTARWNGSEWSVVPSPTGPGSYPSTLYGVDARLADNAWAVGSTNSESMVIRNTRECSTPTRTATPTRTPTACAISFSDVHPDDYFHDAVIYLACHGAISGYADGSFRPYNNTTRGQVTKIVILGFGIPIDTTGGPHFTDVPVDHPFYSYVETANHNGIVSGYGDNTFRPSANVTRGQLSKIVVVAAVQVNGWTLANPPTPTFTDVAPGSAFYPYVETAVSKGVLSGYSDLTFRPGNNATRGQIAKITYLAVITPAVGQRRGE